MSKSGKRRSRAVLMGDAVFRDADENYRAIILGFHNAFIDLDAAKPKINWQGCRVAIAAMTLLGQKGWQFGAEQFLIRHVPQLTRPQLSLMLWRMARMVGGDEDNERCLMRESGLALFGLFIQRLIEDDGAPLRMLELVEDLGTGNAEAGLETQSTALIRGLLSSSHLDVRRSASFWSVAATSTHFPERIFFEPCLPNAGHVFSQLQLQWFGQVLAEAPDAAARRFAIAMRDNIRYRLAIRERAIEIGPDNRVFVSDTSDEFVRCDDCSCYLVNHDGTYRPIDVVFQTGCRLKTLARVELTPSERLVVLREILEQLRRLNAVRHSLIADVFGHLG